MKVILSGGQEKPSFYTYFVGGMIAEAISCSVFVPVDVIKERLQVQTSFSQPSPSSSSSKSPSIAVYNSSYDAFRTIARTEGFRGVYKGYFATLACFGPFSAIYFMLYDSVSPSLLIALLYDLSHHYFGFCRRKI